MKETEYITSNGEIGISEELIIKKVNYAVIKFKVNNEQLTKVVYGKSNVNKAIKEIVERYSLVTSANIEVNIITERRGISFNDFLNNSEVL